MKIVFWGTPRYALPSLAALRAAGHHLAGVVSQPDRRRGRGGQRQPSPVKALAESWGVPVFCPQRIRTDLDVQRQLAALAADIHVVVAFGQILPAEVLELPPLGCWNGHGSLLPRWRGAAPIQWSLICGDAETGVGIMAMEEGLDTGPVLLEGRHRIGLLENASQLADALSHLTADLLIASLPRIEAAGPGEPRQRLERLGVRPQGEEGVTRARPLRKDDHQLDWTLPALAIHRWVMGLHPGAVCRWQDRRLKILASEPLGVTLPVDRAAERSPAAIRLEEEGFGHTMGMASSAPPGTVLLLDGEVGFVVACGDGNGLLVREGQLEGRTTAAAGRLLQQMGVKVGDRLG
jgi:methionyl-tRNA formyltransferase